jgi:hypothetical protein
MFAGHSKRDYSCGQFSACEKQKRLAGKDAQRECCVEIFRLLDVDTPLAQPSKRKNSVTQGKHLAFNVAGLVKQDI